MLALPGLFELSRYLTSWEFSVEPSFEWIELLNGTFAKKHDFGISADKFYTTLGITIPFDKVDSLYSWYNSNKGYELSLLMEPIPFFPETYRTDLDLFFPNRYDDNVTLFLVGLNSLGPVNNNFSKHMRFELKLYMNQVMNYPKVYSVPVCFEKGIWKNDYDFSDTFNTNTINLKSRFTSFKNDKNVWNVSFDYLSRDEANILLSWILTTRTNSVNLSTNEINGSRTSDYSIKSFNFKNQIRSYSANLELVDLKNR